MLRNSARPFHLLALFSMLLAAAAFPVGSSGSDLAAPVPPLLISARTAFVSNLGADGMSIDSVRSLGDPDLPYDLVYGALKSWGRYRLVGSPAEAELVIEVRFRWELSEGEKTDLSAPTLEVRVIDARSHFALWTFEEVVQGALRRSASLRNFDSAVAALVNDYQQVLEKGAPPSS